MRSANPIMRIEIALLIFILLVYGVLAALYATQTPPWQVPDEPAHYNYVRQLVEGVGLPVLAAPDWDLDYLGTLTGSGFDPQYLDDLPAVQYEDHQPPLFYLLAAPVYGLTGGSLIALRLLSALLGAGVVLSLYGVARLATGGDAAVALGAAALAAFIPQHLAILAGAGNDALAELVVGVGLLLALAYAQGTDKGLKPLAALRRITPVHLGVVLGIGFLTKTTTFLLGPVFLLAIWLRWRRAESPRLVDLIRAGAWFALPALLLGGLWWARNVSVYGWPDMLGLARHDAVVVGQPRTADWIAANGVSGWLAEGARVTFQSFWGQFGWMGVPMPGWVYGALLAFTGISWAGWLAPTPRDTSRFPSPTRREESRDALLILAAVFALGIAAFLYYNTAFVQFQGRYLYPALAAFATGMAAGWRGWTNFIGRWISAGPLRALVDWLPTWIMGGLALLSAYALWRFVIPNLPVWP